jgi:hypothetical protein
MLPSRLTLSLACGLFSSIGWANAITVNNFSFETLPPGGLPLACGVGCQYSLDVIPGWTNSGFSGQFQPGAVPNTFFDTLDLGPTIGFTHGPTISQTVAPSVALGVTYTLQVDIGERKDIGSGASVDLLINGNRYFGSGAFVFGGWSTFTATYTGRAADVGDPITIELNVGGGGGQGDFDNVVLSDNLNAVPEPASFGLLASAIAGFAVWYSRRRQTASRN